MKKILFITTYTPCNKTAGPSYSLNLLKDLSDSYHIDLFYFNYKDHVIEKSVQENENISILKCFRVGRFRRLRNIVLIPFLHPIFTGRFSFRILFHLMKNKYDLVYLDFSQVFIYSIFLKSQNKVLMSHDIITQRLKRSHNKFDFPGWGYLSEKFILKRSYNSQICSFSEKDKRLLNILFNIKSFIVDFYINDDIRNVNYNKNKLDNYVFFGAWHRDDNYVGLFWFIDNVLPLIDKKIKFVIIGGGLENSDKIKSCDQINYVGFVKNPYEYIATSKALIAPVFSGAGVKVKVIESLATGTPVFGTPIAFEGINRKFEASLHVCKNAEDFATKINSFKINIDEKVQLKKHFEMNYPKRLMKVFIDNLLVN